MLSHGLALTETAGVTQVTPLLLRSLGTRSCGNTWSPATPGHPYPISIAVLQEAATAPFILPQPKGAQQQAYCCSPPDPPCTLCPSASSSVPSC